MGILRRTDDHFKRGVADRARNGQHGRTTILVSIVGLVLGSLVAVAAPAAAAAKTPAVHATTLGAASTSHVKTGDLTLAGTTPSPFSAAAAKVASTPATHAALPAVGRLRAGVKGGANAATDLPLPVVNCQPAGAGCDSISGSGGATTNPYGMAATDNSKLYNEDIEPPDQGLCAGNGYVMESINIGEVQIFKGSGLAAASSAAALDTLMGLTARGWSSGGDIMCEYNSDNGGHWFITEIVSTTSSPFTGCFAGILEGCREGLAVSTGSNPLTSSWNIYFIDANHFSPKDPGAGYLLNDYGKMGTTSAALLFFYDEFNLSGSLPPCPAFGCDQFNGAQEFAIQKTALEQGRSKVYLVHENMGTDPSIQPPDGNCDNGATAGVTCWYQVIPATSPAGQYDNSHGGTGFMAATLDFNSFTFGNGTGDNRAAVFYWTGLNSLTSAGCSACGSIRFGGTLFTGVETYSDSGQACPTSTGNPCGMAPQRHGTLDLGTYCEALGLATESTCPEEGIATNGDGVTQASYSGGQLWFAVSTLISETFGANSEIHVGSAYFVVGTSGFGGSSHALSMTSQGYVAAAHEDMEFPTLVGGTNNALMSFTLSGDGGPTHADGGGYFPSSAYGWVTSSSSGLVGRAVHVTVSGKAPQDGFSEYQGLPGPIRPRWGDYGAAVYVPGSGYYFASEYIQYPNCNPRYFYETDPTCGGTRDEFANFGTSVNFVK